MSSFKVPDDVLYVFKTYLGPPCAFSSSMVCKQWRRMMCVEALTPYHVLSITEHQLQPILAAIRECTCLFFFSNKEDDEANPCSHTSREGKRSLTRSVVR